MKYIVFVQEILTYHIPVEAPTVEVARERAAEIIDGDPKMEPESVEWVDMEDWDVMEEPKGKETEQSLR